VFAGIFRSLRWAGYSRTLPVWRSTKIIYFAASIFLEAGAAFNCPGVGAFPIRTPPELGPAFRDFPPGKRTIFPRQFSCKSKLPSTRRSGGTLGMLFPEKACAAAPECQPGAQRVFLYGLRYDVHSVL